jgi:hypothetical protein
VSKFFGYQFSVEFKLGRQNVMTDALSHQHEEDTTVHALFIPNFALLDEFCVEAATLPEVIAKCIELTTGTTGPEWALVDDLVVWCDRLFLPPSASMWPLVLEDALAWAMRACRRLCNDYAPPPSHRATTAWFVTSSAAARCASGTRPTISTRLASCSRWSY